MTKEKITLTYEAEGYSASVSFGDGLITLSKVEDWLPIAMASIGFAGYDGTAERVEYEEWAANKELREELAETRRALEALVLKFYYDNGSVPEIIEARRVLNDGKQT